MGVESYLIGKGIPWKLAQSISWNLQDAQALLIKHPKEKKEKNDQK